MLHRLSPTPSYTPLKYVLFLLGFHSDLLLFVLLNHLIAPALLNIAENVANTHCIHHFDEVSNKENHEVCNQRGTKEVAYEKEAFRH